VEGEEQIFSSNISQPDGPHLEQKFAEFFPPTRKIHKEYLNTVSYRPVAKRRLCKQRQFLGNGSENTFPLIGSRFLITQQLKNMFSMWSLPRCYKQGTKLLKIVSCARKVVKRVPELVAVAREQPVKT
jgi:hypothetical protein